MTQPHSAHDTTPYGHPEIPAAIWSEYRHQDWYAARNIVVLMTSIFLVGVALYLGIAYWVDQSPNYFAPGPSTQPARYAPIAH